MQFKFDTNRGYRVRAIEASHARARLLRLCFTAASGAPPISYQDTGNLHRPPTRHNCGAAIIFERCVKGLLENLIWQS